jgi:peptidylprolyl isomerase
VRLGKIDVSVLLCGLLAGLCLIVAGCGGGDSSNAAAEDSEGSIPTSPPKVEVPAGLPPKKLVVKDLEKGAGAEAKKGDEVTLQYYCVIWENGVEYANSWTYNGPPAFVLGEHVRLLRGLNLAVPGMREGGDREVLIPSNLVFYPEVSHSHLGRLAALICKVYLVKVLNRGGK